MSFWRKKFVSLDAGFAHYLNRLNYLGIKKKTFSSRLWYLNCCSVKFITLHHLLEVFVRFFFFSKNLNVFLQKLCRRKNLEDRLWSDSRIIKWMIKQMVLLMGGKLNAQVQTYKLNCVICRWCKWSVWVGVFAVWGRWEMSTQMCCTPQQAR